MGLPNYVYMACGIGLAFGGWGIIARASGTPGAWVGVLLLVGSIVGNMLIGGREIFGGPLFTVKNFTIMMVAGTVNGIALYYYGKTDANQEIPGWIFIATVTVFMTMWAPILNIFTERTSISLLQGAGLLLCLGGIVLINFKPAT